MNPRHFIMNSTEPTLGICEILEKLARMSEQSFKKVMIHEQYFYKDYLAYQPEFEEKLRSTFSFFRDNGYQSSFYENLIS